MITALSLQVSRHAKRLNLLLVRFAVAELLFDLLYRTAAALLKPRRELFRTVLAQIAVVQLAVAEHTDLISADIAEFLIEKSHLSVLPFLFSGLSLYFTSL